jgi:outer membrane protein assembly factor BamB
VTLRAFPTLLALALASCATETGGYWPQWRGPLRDNISRETNLLQEWPPGGPPLQWSADGVGAGIGTVSVAGGRIFVMGFLGDFEYLTAVEEETGKRLWVAPIGSNRGIIQSELMRWLSQRTPTVDGDRVYAFSGDARLTCVDAATGRELWRKDYIQDLGGTRSAFGVCDYPLVDGDQVVCVIGGPAPAMAALDKYTGAVRWRSATPVVQSGDSFDGEWGSTVVAEADGVRQYLAFLRHGLAGFRASDGALLWTYDRIAKGPYRYSHTPILSEDLVIATTGNGGGMAGLKLRRSADGVAVDEKYFVARTSMQFTQDSSIVLDNRLYGLYSWRVMICWDARTGVRVWHHRLAGQRGSPSFTVAGERLILHFSDGPVVLAAITPEGILEKSSFTVPGETVDAGAAMPVVAGGRLYLRRENSLFAYDLREAPPASAPATRRLVFTPPETPSRDELPKERRAAFVSTPEDVVHRMLRMAAVKKADVVCDLGSGDGRIVRIAARDHGTRAIGYEIDPELVRLSRSLTEAWGLQDRVTIMDQDMFTADLTSVTVLALYLPEEFLKKLMPQFAKLKPGARIVSHQFRLPGVVPTRSLTAVSSDTGRVHGIYLYEVPLREEGK